jgi:hypothetical protein
VVAVSLKITFSAFITHTIDHFFIVQIFSLEFLKFLACNFFQTMLRLSILNSLHGGGGEFESR